MRHEIERFNADVATNPAIFMAALDGDHGLENIIRAATRMGYDFDLEDAQTYIRDRMREDEWANVVVDVDSEGEVELYTSDQLGSTIAVTNTVVVTEAMMVAHAIGIAEVAAAAIVIGVIVLISTETDVTLQS
ncbi:hypothetical protein [Brevundimonas sp.]|uniref:hypothetical protein n=1 Tax=Brevundimonas sp. TaxID=1871086 RepID=UPI003918E2B6